MAFSNITIYSKKIVNCRLKTALKYTIYPLIFTNFILHGKIREIDSTNKEGSIALNPV